MPDISAIRVDQVEPNTVVRVLLQSVATSRRSRRNAVGLFRVKPGGEEDTINPREWRRLVGFSRRKFIARVILNDTTERLLTLQIENAQTSQSTEIRYNVVLRYDQVIRLARLVQQGREFTSDEKEQAFRRQHRSTPIDKAFFDPKDRFVGVSMIAIVGDPPMITNFTFQVGSTGPSFTVPLPAGVFEDGDYTVQATYNTPVGSPAQLWVPDSGRTKDDFVVNSLGGTDVDAGTTIDFHVQPR